MRSITKVCKYYKKDKIQFCKTKDSVEICSHGRSGWSGFTPKQARKLFQAGLQMCDELEGKGK